ncbi:methyltransferase LaeA [Xylariaceae sp. FL0016]|nr:methyltransferase LaeA [Xylariaceae sp. FL0016]
MASNGYYRDPEDHRDPDVRVVYKGGFYHLNNRVYSHIDKYLFPCDQTEQERLDIFHKLCLVARGQHLYQRQLPVPARVLDLGCGTGIWVNDLADQLWRANGDGTYHITGWDLTSHQSPQIPRGVDFEVRDIDKPWVGVEPDLFDMIHIRMLVGGITSWERVYEQALRHLKPGTGTLEHVEIDFRPIIDGPSSDLEKTSLLRWSQDLQDKMCRLERELHPRENTIEILTSLGYVNIDHDQMRLPLNPAWPEKPHEKEIGKWFNLGVCQGLQALSLRPLTFDNHYTKIQLEELITGVKKDICNRNLRAYCIMHIWTAQRPPSPTRRV